jgi:hypothetical protein
VKRRLVRAPLIAATAAALALTASGCGGSDTDPGAGAADSSTSTTAAEPTTSAAETDPQGSSTTPSTARPPDPSDGEANDNSDADQGDGSNGDASTNAPAGGGASGTGGSPAAAGTVRLTLKVTGCATCTFSAFTTERGTTRPLGARTVSGGVATWTLTRAQTSGLAFTVTTPQGEGVSNAQAAMVWQYSGLTVGSRITDAQAARSDRGTWCWSGTSSPRVTVPVTVVRFNELGSDSRARSLRVYANPMASGQAPFVETSRGALGVQDDPFCPG